MFYNIHFLMHIFSKKGITPPPPPPHTHTHTHTHTKSRTDRNTNRYCTNCCSELVPKSMAYVIIFPRFCILWNSLCVNLLCVGVTVESHSPIQSRLLFPVSRVGNTSPLTPSPHILPHSNSDPISCNNREVPTSILDCWASWNTVNSKSYVNKN